MSWPETTRRTADGSLEFGGVSAVDLAREFGTPLYVFDEETLRSRARRIRDEFLHAYERSRLVYAGKAYLSPALMRHSGRGGDRPRCRIGRRDLRRVARRCRSCADDFSRQQQEPRRARGGRGRRCRSHRHRQRSGDHPARERGARLGTDRRRSSCVSIPVSMCTRITRCAPAPPTRNLGSPCGTAKPRKRRPASAGRPGSSSSAITRTSGLRSSIPRSWRDTIDVIMEFAGRVHRRCGVIPTVVIPGGGFGVADDASGADVPI